MTGLDGATTLVTGATGQVGWGFAHAAAAAGARLLLTASRPASAARLTTEFPQAVVVTVDLTAGGAGQTIQAAVDDTGGRLDHVFAPIGGWWQLGPTLDQPTGELQQLLATYAVAQHRLVLTTAPFLAHAGGSYTLVTGAAGRRPIPDAGMLVVAVRAQWGLAEVLRAELADAPFRFNELRISTRRGGSPKTDSSFSPDQLQGTYWTRFGRWPRRCTGLGWSRRRRRPQSLFTRLGEGKPPH